MKPPPIKITIKPHFDPPYTAEVAKITSKWIMVICNIYCTVKYSRKTGWATGAFKDRMNLTPSKIVEKDLQKLEKIATEAGGTWTSNWKAVKHPSPKILTPEEQAKQFEKDKQACYEYRKKHFEAKMSKPTGDWTPEEQVLHVTHNGSHWQVLGMTRDEAIAIIKLLKIAFDIN